MSASTSLVKLSVSAIIHQDGTFVEGCDLNALPRSLLQEILVSSVSHSRILCLRSLITKWPLEHLVLQNVPGFDEPKAVLLAYCLQRTQSNIKLVDMRGCNIGVQGTTAFCKLAINLPVSDNDVAGMKILDTRPTPDSMRQNATTELPRQRIPPMVVMLDAVVNHKNCDLVIQACTGDSVMDLKMSHVTMHEIGERDVHTLLKTLEPEITTGLDMALNGLQQRGIIAISPAILPLSNLTKLNLSYNQLWYQHTSAIEEMANICGNLAKLKKLDLSGNYIKGGVCIILQRLQSSLTHLSLGGCGVEEGNLREMCSLETIGHLQSLRLESSGLVDCIDSLCSFILKSANTLEYLSVEDNMFDSSSVAPLCQTVKQLPLLKMLSLSYNHFLCNDIRTFREEFPTLEIIDRDLLY